MTTRARSRNPKPVTVSPGEVVLSEIGLMPTVNGLQGDFPGLHKSTVWRWSQPETKGGTDGIVPSRYHLPLMRLAKRLGRTLTADDLVMGRQATGG